MEEENFDVYIGPDGVHADYWQDDRVAGDLVVRWPTLIATLLDDFGGKLVLSVADTRTLEAVAGALRKAAESIDNFVCDHSEH